MECYFVLYIYLHKKARTIISVAYMIDRK